MVVEHVHDDSRILVIISVKPPFAQQELLVAVGEGIDPAVKRNTFDDAFR